LEGALGTGKTCLAQGIGRGCGVTEALISPTFIFIHEYRLAKTGTQFNHVDLYRISNVTEAEDLGLNDYLDDGTAITVIEWPEQAEEILPEDRLWISIRYIESNKRILLFSAHGVRFEALLRDFRRRAFGV
jgi:tRNA threonylcarbamoyladenosine biosynthesis protein TsaE